MRVDIVCMCVFGCISFRCHCDVFEHALNAYCERREVLFRVAPRPRPPRPEPTDLPLYTSSSSCRREKSKNKKKRKFEEEEN